AEQNRINAQATTEQRRVQRDQAQAAYNKIVNGPTEWDMRLAEERVDAARAQLDLTKNPDPARVKQAQLNVDAASLPLAARRKQIGFDIQQAQEGVTQALASQSKVQNPSDFDVQAADAQAQAADAQAQAAAAQAAAGQAQVDTLRSQRAGAV